MRVLQVPLSSISEDGFSVETETSGPALRPAGAKDLPVGPVSVSGTLTPEGEAYIFTGRVAGTHLGTCDRCLRPAKVPFSLDVYWLFMPGEEAPSEEEPDGESEGGLDDGDSCTMFTGNVIDLVPRVWEEMVLSMPIKVLCSEDCAGLCPVCGANRNEVRCSCGSSTAFTTKGLKGLKEMFPDLTPDRLED